MNLLFICRYNQMRSRTAESIYNSDSMYNTRSAGTMLKLNSYWQKLQQEDLLLLAQLKHTTTTQLLLQ